MKLNGENYVTTCTISLGSLRRTVTNDVILILSLLLKKQ